MNIFNLTKPYKLNCIPRAYNDGVITLLLRDELKDLTYTIAVDSIYYQNSVLMLEFSDITLKEGQSFEVIIKENDQLIYRGKAYATAQTDFENFELNKGVLKA